MSENILKVKTPNKKSSKTYKSGGMQREGAAIEKAMAKRKKTIETKSSMKKGRNRTKNALNTIKRTS